MSRWWRAADRSPRAHLRRVTVLSGFGARKYSTAPAGERGPPAISWSRVAPARMPSATSDATTGTTGPNGTVKVGGATACIDR